MKRQLASIAVWGFLGAFGLSAVAGSDESQTNAPAEIRVGVRTDARPFSYLGASEMVSIMPGYTGYMVSICRRVLRDIMLRQPFTGLRVVTHRVNAADRFEQLDNGKVDLLCGPDSITLERLRHYSVSHPVFLSGIAYAYLDADSELFPRSRYCKAVVGVVGGTTASSVGLNLLADSGALLRFDQALELYLAAYYERRSTQPIRRTDDRRGNEIDASGVSLARMVKTRECPDGFEAEPVIYYDNHSQGVAAFCRGEVLYYLGDVDIIRRKLQAAANCPYTLDRYTMTREVYGVYFRRGFDMSSPRPEGWDATLYTAFNNALLRMMQASSNILDYEFEREFGDDAQSEDLREFFQSFKFATNY